MTGNTDAKVDRVLVVHGDAAVRGAVAAAARNIGDGATTVYESVSLTDAVDKARRFDPRVVLLDLGESRALALDVARRLRRNDRLLVGLYDPLVVGHGESDLLRAATRAGIGDFVTVPVAEADLADAFLSSMALNGSEPHEEEGRTIAFFSQKGGVGTTTLAVNVALSLAQASPAAGVALCDAHLQFGDAAGLLGIRPEHDLCDLVLDLDNLGPLDSYLSREPRSGLLLLPGPTSVEAGERISPADVSRALIALRQRYARVVVDVPHPIDLLSLGLLDLAETICIVTDPVTPSVLGTAGCLKFLAGQGFGDGRLRVVLNREGYPHGAMSEAEVANTLECDVAAAIPFDARVVDAADTGEPLVLTRGKSDFQRGLSSLIEQLSPAAAAVRDS